MSIVELYCLGCVALEFDEKGEVCSYIPKKNCFRHSCVVDEDCMLDVRKANIAASNIANKSRKVFRYKKAKKEQHAFSVVASEIRYEGCDNLESRYGNNHCIFEFAGITPRQAVEIITNGDCGER